MPPLAAMHRARSRWFGVHSASPEQVLRKVGLIRPGEQFIGVASGGSESLVFHIQSASNYQVVRKVSSRGLSTADWRPAASGIMSDPYERARQQVEYIQALPAELQDLFPSLYSARTVDMNGALGCNEVLVADYEHVDGVTVSDFARSGSGSPAEILGIYRDIARILSTQVHTHAVAPPECPSVEDQHLKKVEGRLDLALQSWPWGQKNIEQHCDHVVINGRKLRTITSCLRAIRADSALLRELEPPAYTLVVGDLNTQNVILSPHSGPRPGGGIRFIDPRGIGPERRDGLVVDDPLYDWKYWHNSVGHYDSIYGGFYSLASASAGRQPLEIVLASTDGNPLTAAYSHLPARFLEVVGQPGHLDGDLIRLYGDSWELRFLFLMGSHFAAMLPFHLDPNSSDEDAPIVAMYCESVRWLNACLNNWVGAESFEQSLTDSFWQ
jgi:hypothetical protein